MAWKRHAWLFFGRALLGILLMSLTNTHMMVWIDDFELVMDGNEIDGLQ